MIKIRDKECNFSMGNPAHVARFAKEDADHRARIKALSEPRIDPNDEERSWLQDYIKYLNDYLASFVVYVDNVFGEGTAEMLLGTEPGLDEVLAADKEIAAAMDAATKKLESASTKYTPNRATRRSKK